MTAVRHRTLLLAGALAGCLWLLVSLGCSSGSRAQGTTTAAGRPSGSGAAATVHHYEYAFPDGSIYVSSDRGSLCAFTPSGQFKWQTLVNNDKVALCGY